MTAKTLRHQVFFRVMRTLISQRVRWADRTPGKIWRTLDTGQRFGALHQQCSAGRQHDALK